MWSPTPSAVTAVKVCPVVLRGGAILALRHPRTGLQLVKGSVEDGEAYPDAARRELFEEAGLVGTPVRNLGKMVLTPPPIPWSFWLMKVPRGPERWLHHCADDGGQNFRFFWWPLDRAPGPAWHPIHGKALAAVRHRLRRDRPRQPT